MHSNQKTSAAPRILELDGLRAIAVVSVMCIHFATNRAFMWGWMGVDLFFVLSGFLITGVLLNLRSDLTPYRKFYVRRAQRIFPAYYIVLAIIALVASLHHEDFFRLGRWLQLLFFLPAIRVGVSWSLVLHRLHGAAFDYSVEMFRLPNISQYFYGLGVYWSLAVEELFYLFWAPIVLKLSRRLVITFAIVPLLLCPLLRGLTHTSEWKEAFGFITRFDSIAAGACLCLLLDAKPRFSAKYLLTLSVLFCGLSAYLWMRSDVGIEPRSEQFFAIFGYSVLALFFASAIGVCIQLKGASRLAFLRFKPLVYVGTISYTMYLTHFFFYIAVARWIMPPVPRALVAFTVTVMVASFSWKYMEKPILHYRRR